MHAYNNSTEGISDNEGDFDSSTNGGAEGSNDKKRRVVHVTPLLVNESDDNVYLRVGRGCVLGTNVLPSLLCYEDAPEWKDEVDNGVPIVGCTSSITAVAVVTT